MNHSRRAGAAALILAGALCVSALAPAPTDAAWVDRDVATDVTLQAGTVTPVTQMTCTAGLLQPVTFTWAAPAGGLPRSGYHWTVTGGITGSGDLPANATSVTLTTGVLGIGSGTFSLTAVGPGGWRSVVKTGSVSFLRLVLDVVSSCSVT